MTKKGLIIINLGSPESYSKADVKTYLDEFLMDEKVHSSDFVHHACKALKRYEVIS